MLHVAQRVLPAALKKCYELTNFELQWKSEVELIEDELVDVVDDKNDVHISAVERMLDSMHLIDDDGIDDEPIIM